MKIKPTDQTLQQLLASSFYEIPRFQRPYRWSAENLNDFWQDVVERDTSDYFLGSMVLYRTSETSQKFFVVDGQQRLTTIFVTLCAIRNRLLEIQPTYEAATSAAKGIHSLIEKTDIENVKKFTLASEEMSADFLDNIFKYPENLEPNDGWTGDEANADLAFACQFIRSKVNTHVGAATDPQLIIKLMREVRDKLNSVKVIFIELTNEDDAYLIFETLNTRGKDLSVGDLVKNHILRQLKQTNSQLDSARSTWIKTVSVIEGAKNATDFDTFLLHQWLSEREYIAERNLFRSIKSNVKTAASTKNYLAKIASDAKLYRAIVEPEYQNWSKPERPIRASLDALLVFRVRRSYPLVLSILRSYFSKSLSRANTQTFMEMIERFHFLFTAVTAQRAGGGVASMYALTAREIAQATDEQKKRKSLLALKGKFKDRVPGRDEFVAGFSQIVYTNDVTRNRELVRYILTHLDRHIRKVDGVDYSSYTIEHIKSQSEIVTAEDETIVGSLGNLLFVPTSVNEKLKNKNWTEKKEILKKAGFLKEATLEKATNWDNKKIQKRTEELADLAYSKVWAL